MNQDPDRRPWLLVVFGLLFFTGMTLLFVFIASQNPPVHLPG